MCVLWWAAMMAYRSVAATHNVQKFFHMFLHLLAICLGIIGICAVFKFHDMIKAEDVYSLHSWIGIATITLYCLQVTTKNQVYQLTICHIFSNFDLLRLSLIISTGFVFFVVAHRLRFIHVSKSFTYHKV